MKSLRIFLLVLLAALLPIRGAVAAVMLCAGGSHGAATVGATAHPAPTSRHLSAAHCHDMAAEPDQADGQADGQTPCAPHAGGCNLCASCCAVTPPLSTMPALPQALAVSSVRFPALSAPAATHQSGGQDRPPRST